jgi:hypothetical protein
MAEATAIGRACLSLGRVSRPCRGSLILVYTDSCARIPTASAVGYDLPPYGAGIKKLGRYLTLVTTILSGLPFFAEPRNLEMAKFMEVRWQEARYVGF